MLRSIFTSIPGDTLDRSVHEGGIIGVEPPHRELITMLSKEVTLPGKSSRENKKNLFPLNRLLYMRPYGSDTQENINHLLHKYYHYILIQDSLNKKTKIFIYSRFELYIITWKKNIMLVQKSSRKV